MAWLFPTERREREREIGRVIKYSFPHYLLFGLKSQKWHSGPLISCWPESRVTGLVVYYTTKNVVSGSRLTEGGQSDVVSFVVWVLIRFCISFAPQRLGRNLGLVPLHWRLASSSTPDFGLMGSMEREGRQH